MLIEKLRGAGHGLVLFMYLLNFFNNTNIKHNKTKQKLSSKIQVNK